MMQTKNGKGTKAGMVIIVNGRKVRLSAADTKIRQDLIRDAVKVTVARYRPALERLEKV